MKYEIEKDKYLGLWVVWLIQGNARYDIKHSKTKKEAKEWLKTII